MNPASVGGCLRAGGSSDATDRFFAPDKDEVGFFIETIGRCRTNCFGGKELRVKRSLLEDIKTEKIYLNTIGSIDCISIIVNYSHRTVIRDFRFKRGPQGLGLVTRTGEFLDEWKGCVYLEGQLPILHLTKIDSRKVDIKIPLLKFGLLGEAQFIYELSFAQVIVKLEAHLSTFC